MRGIRGKLRNRSVSHRKALVRILVAQLIKHDAIKTTKAKAKAIKPTADRVVRWAKRGGQRNYIRALGFLRCKDAAKKLFNEFPRRYRNRPCGYTTMFRLPNRKGDYAEMAYIMYLDTEKHRRHLEFLALKDNQEAQEQLLLEGEEARAKRIRELEEEDRKREEEMVDNPLIAENKKRMDDLGVTASKT